MRRKLGDDVIAQRKEMLLDALSKSKGYGDVASILGLSRECTNHWIGLYGLRDKARQIISANNERDTEEAVLMLKKGVSDAEVASMLGMAVSRVTAIRRHHGIFTYHRCRSGSTSGTKKMMMVELAGKYTFEEIAKAFGCSKQYVHQVVTEHRNGGDE